MPRLCNLFRSAFVTFFLLAFAATSMAHADEIKSVKGMLEKAVERGDEASFDTVLTMALATWPDKRGALLEMAEGIQVDWMATDQIEEIVIAREAAAAAEAASRARGIIYYLDPALWNGQAELGAGSSTGDTDEKSLSVGLSFHRKFGPQWEHDLDMDFDYARSSGETKRQKFVGKYETIWRPWSSAFLLNYTELELDRFSGYDYRVVENIGVGFDLLNKGAHKLRLEGGPGLRFSQFKETGETETEFLGRLSTTYDWKISETMALRDRTSVIFATESTTFENDLQFQAKLNSHLAARLTLGVKYDSAPPEGTAAWDTSTRATLVYGF